MNNEQPHPLDTLESLRLTPETWAAELMALLDAIELEWAMQDELGIDPPQTRAVCGI